MNKKRLGILRGPLMYVLLIFVIILVIQMLGNPGKNDTTQLTYSELLDWVRADLDESDPAKSIKCVSITNFTLKGLRDDTTVADKDFDTKYDFIATVPSEAQFYTDVEAIYASAMGREVNPTEFAFTFESKLPPVTPWWVEWIPFFILMLVFGVFWYLMMRQQAGGGKSAMTFGKSHARLTDPAKNVVRFADVAGADEEKDELREIVQFLKDPQRFTKVGARIPTGLLMVGPPGTGKTLLARAVAGEAGVPFFTVSGSDFVEMFVGVGASRVRDLFDQAKKCAPSIIFIDEIDAVGRQRGTGLGGGHDEREQTLNQILVEMDGFTHNEGVIVMAATNRSDVLDPALLRPGRFDRRIVVNYPDVKGREEILKIHAKGKPIAADVDLAVLARRTPMFTGADLMNVMNEAAILTARRGLDKITMPLVEEAITRVIAGPEKKSRKVTEKDRLLVAYHEAGHAIVSYYVPECDKVHEITTIPRGQAGGYTMYLPKEEINYVTSARLNAEMCSLMGGRVAEAIVFDDISTGASSDIKRATEIARGMVTEYGMSDKLGPIFLGEEHEVFLGKSFAQQSNGLSNSVSEMVDSEVRGLLSGAYDRAKQILREHIDQLHALARLLIEREKLDYEEFDCFMSGRSLPEKAVARPVPADRQEPQSAAEEPVAEETPAVENPAPEENPPADLASDDTSGDDPVI